MSYNRWSVCDVTEQAFTQAQVADVRVWQ